MYLILAHLVSPRSVSVGSAGGFVPRSTRRPPNRLTAVATTVGAAPPEAPAQPRPPPHQDEETDPVLPDRPKWPAKMAPRVLFFSFLIRGEIPRQCGVEIPPRDECPLRRLWLRPTYEEIPVKLTFRAFSRPKWRGCGPQANLRGFFPPTTPARGCSPFLRIHHLKIIQHIYRRSKCH